MLSFVVSGLLTLVSQSEDFQDPFFGELSGFQSLKGLLPQPLTDYSSIQEILEDLPEEFRSSYSLVRMGGGLQPGTDEFPRVVMTYCKRPCKDPFPVLGFHGNPQARNYNTLETLEFDPRTGKIELQFIKEGDLGLEFSKKNPAVCAQCHFNNPKLIWSSYPRWSSLYRPEIHVPISNEEKELLEKFWKNRESNSRYAVLGDKRDVFINDNPSINPNYELDADPNNPNRLFLKNVALAMSVISDGIVTRTLKRLPGINHLKYTIAGLASGCSTEQMIPWELGDKFPDDLWVFERRVAAARARRHPSHQTDFNFPNVVTANFSYFFDHLGIEPGIWFGEGRLPESKKQYLPSTTDAGLWRAVRMFLLDKDLTPFKLDVKDFEDWRYPMTYDCESLSPVSQQALTEYEDF